MGLEDSILGKVLNLHADDLNATPSTIYDLEALLEVITEH